MKIGIDVHGVVDELSLFFIELSRLFVAAGHEVHILTGRRQSEIEPKLKMMGLQWTHFFSMTDYHESIGTPMTYGPHGNPWMDEDLWNRTKAEYAERVGLTIHFDDSDVYWPHFKTGYARVIPYRKVDEEISFGK